VIAIGPPFLGRLPLPTVPGYPPDLQLDWAIQETRRRHPADQFLNAEILRAADAGRALINDDLQPGAIGQAVQAMLGDCPERQAASRVRDEIASMPAPADVVPALVELAGR